MSVDEYDCPSGFDCVYQNSCPSLLVNIPDGTGFFAGSYSGHPFEADIDKAFQDYSERDGTPNRSYIPPSRSVQVDCLIGFYCPDSMTMIPCPSGHYCTEGSSQPIKCDGGSICGERSRAEFNLVNIIIAALFSVLISIGIGLLTKRQRSREAATRSLKSAPPSSPAPPAEVSVTMSQQELDNITEGISFDITHFSVYHRFANVETQLLRPVTARVPARFCAIMGPSGCGKSTLVNALGGRLGLLKSRGLIRYTLGDAALELSPEQLQHHITVVPQEDVVDRSLTVRELLVFNACARLRLSRSEASKAAERVMQTLGIAHVADTVIGGSANKAANVSGGQLKRINIACELVSLRRPAVLIADEVTSGLDSAIANELCASLAELPKDGVTVLMVLQQPRPEIFARFEYLLLMQRGTIVYEGPSRSAAAHFESLGVPHPKSASDADFCIDVLNGIVLPRRLRGVRRDSSVDSLASGDTAVSNPLDESVNASRRVIFDPDYFVDAWRFLCSGGDVEFFRQKYMEGSAVSSSAPPSAVKPQRLRPAANASSRLLAAPSRGLSSLFSALKGVKAPASTPDASPVPSPSSSSLSLPELERQAVSPASTSAGALQQSPKAARRNNLTKEERQEEKFRLQQALAARTPRKSVALPISAESRAGALRSYARLLLMHAERALLGRARAPTAIVVNAGLHAVMAVALSVGFSLLMRPSWRGTYAPPLWEPFVPYCPAIIRDRCMKENTFGLGMAQLLFFISMSVGSAGSLGAVPLLEAQPLLKRETAAGLPPSAFVIGRMLGDLVNVGFLAAVYTGVWALFLHPGHWYDWLLVIFGTSFAVSGLGYLASVITRASNAPVVSVLMIVIFSVFSGVNPTLQDVKDLHVLNWMFYAFSYSTWTAEGTYYTWAMGAARDSISEAAKDRIKVGAEHFGYHIDGIGRSIGVLIAIGLMWRIATFIILKIKLRL